MCTVSFNESLKKNKLKRHLETKHPQHLKKNPIFFSAPRNGIDTKQNELRNESSAFSLQASHAGIVYCLAAHRYRNETHTIGERLEKLAAIDMARLMCGDNAASKLQSVSLSRDTVKSRIEDFSLNIKNQVVAQMKKAGKWSYQLDQSTDTGKNAQLMVYVRYKGEMNCVLHTANNNGNWRRHL